jgi:hypothetical protein
VLIACPNESVRLPRQLDFAKQRKELHLPRPRLTQLIEANIDTDGQRTVFLMSRTRTILT